MTSDVAALEPTAVVRRRRGAELEDAICQAAFDEFTEYGYTNFTIESVAARAQTGKASIYRRWPTKDGLLLDAFCRGVPTPEGCFIVAGLGDDVSTRDALLTIVRVMREGMNGPKAVAVHAIASEAARDAEFAKAVDREILAPRRQGLVDLFRRGIEIGDVCEQAPVEFIAEIVPALHMMRAIFRHETPTDEEIVGIVDRVVMPLLSCPGDRAEEHAGHRAARRTAEGKSAPRTDRQHRPDRRRPTDVRTDRQNWPAKSSCATWVTVVRPAPYPPCPFSEFIIARV